MPASMDWADPIWVDPEGGSMHLHGTLPTVVFPNVMRPRQVWHGLALLETPDVVDLWMEEEADEAASQGVNMTHALLSGGAFGRYAEGISVLEELQGGRFPDPEPRRLQRIAERHQRPVFYIEPLADDPEWNDFLTREARAMSHWRKLLAMIRLGKRWKKSVKRHVMAVTPPPKGQSVDYASASVMASAWWDLARDMSTPALNEERDLRFASRLRGALASLRAVHGDGASLLVVLHQPHREALLKALGTRPRPEEISSTPTATQPLEEE